MLDVKTISRKYFQQQLLVVVALTLVSLLIVRVWNMYDLITPIIVSSVFSLCLATAIATGWKCVAKANPDNLPAFFIAVSGIRFFLALATMFIYYLVNGHGAMLKFFIIFMGFFLIALAHHTFYFSVVSNRN